MNKALPIPMAGEKHPAVILADGCFPRRGLAADILSNAGRLVCCDGSAVKAVEHGFHPCAVVGDLDSLPPGFLDCFNGRICRDPDQEYNDLTKAVMFCLSEGMAEIIILGATGMREDHTLGNISLLADYMRMEGIVSVRMVTDYGVFDPIECDTEFDSHPAQQVSIFTFSPGTLITTHNLKYPLKEAPFNGWWPGTLNESLGDAFAISTTGPSLVYRVFRHL